MRYLETVMGVPMSIDIRDAGDHDSTAGDAFGELRRADELFSPYRPESELSQVNRGELAPTGVDALFSEVLVLAERFSAVSGGVFTLRDAEGRLDLNGIVKGWAAQRAGDLLRSRGIRDFCVNAGGDIVAAGRPAPGRRWQIGVRSPESADQMIAVFALTDETIATSGSYERGSHIIDGRTGMPATGLLSVSVIAPDLTTADVLATAVYAMGADGVSWAAERYECAIFAVADSGEIIDGGDVRRALAIA
ncbi:MAG TPA: FAD:protein FMN transferase [Microbacteriaceae bacterium]|jgi:thiamine biosynthesis lipoprotein|nr:FAD:protein FMN transferase [Microbacteriaceae bacterium]